MVSSKALRALIIITVGATVTPAANAKGFKYSYAEAGYQYVSGDPENFKLGTVAASFGVFEYVALRGAFMRGKVEDYKPAKNASDPDFTEFQVGARGHYPLMKKKLDAYAGATWFYNSINSNSTGVSSVSDGGGIFDAGVRFQATKNWELDGGFGYRTGDYDKAFAEVRSLYKFTKKVSVSLQTRQSNDIQTYFGGFRLNF